MEWRSDTILGTIVAYIVWIGVFAFLLVIAGIVVFQGVTSDYVGEPPVDETEFYSDYDGMADEGR